MASLRALLDAASIGWSGKPSDANVALRGIAELLDEQAARVQDGHGTVPVALMNAVLEALDHEIERWEKRAATDVEARAVLRTFLGLREILWEFGLRRSESDGPQTAARPRKGSSGRAQARRKPAPGKDSGSPAEPGSPRKPGGRVQRVDVQGS